VVSQGNNAEDSSYHEVVALTSTVVERASQRKAAAKTKQFANLRSNSGPLGVRLQSHQENGPNQILPQRASHDRPNPVAPDSKDQRRQSIAQHEGSDFDPHQSAPCQCPLAHPLSDKSRVRHQKGEAQSADDWGQSSVAEELGCIRGRDPDNGG